MRHITLLFTLFFVSLTMSLHAQNDTITTYPHLENYSIKLKNFDVFINCELRERKWDVATLAFFSKIPVMRLNDIRQGKGKIYLQEVPMILKAFNFSHFQILKNVNRNEHEVIILPNPKMDNEEFQVKGTGVPPRFKQM